MEVNGSGEKYGFSESKLFETMTAHGFQACTYLPVERRLVDAQPNAPRGTDNTIFVRDIDAVRHRLRDAAPFSVNGKRF